MPRSPRSFPPVSAVFLAASASLLLAAPTAVRAQSHPVTIKHPVAIGADRALKYPYNFTGRTFDFNTGGRGSGTLIRRHTVITAGHVVYDPANGFATGLTFTRGLDGEAFISRQQVASVGVLSGYTAAADAAGEGLESLESGSLDTGYMLISDPPVDDNWGTYYPMPSALADSSARFVLGYPAVSFDGRTMAVTLPTTPFVQIGATDSQYYVNEEFLTEPGNSGGPVYSVQNSQQVIVATLVAGDDYSTVEGLSFVRAIDNVADELLTGAEYTSGLIDGIRIKGPHRVARGATVVYKLLPTFASVATVDGSASTNRYKELALQSDNAGTLEQPLVTVTKINNKKFRVTFSSRLRSRSQITLSAGYALPSTSQATTTPGASADDINLLDGATFTVNIQ